MLVATLGLLAQMAVVPRAEAGAEERAARDARSAQERFERVRRANLPRKADGGGPGRCDATIGRFCYWYDSTTTEAVPEPPRITEARLALLAVLDSVAERRPEDPWVMGQRVRYYIEAGNLDDASRVARSCRAVDWWCAALAGAVHHVSRQYVAADSAFAVALRRMPEAQRCEWLDVGLIVDGRWRRALRESSCDRREKLAGIAFTLGRPLWMVPGSDLRTEHFTRHTMALVYERSANAYGMSFGWDSRELMLRYGWPDWYTRHELSVAAFPSFAVTGHDREPTYYFFPDVPNLETARPGPDAWKLRATRVPTRYAPRHVERMTRLTHQLARFARGDSLLVVATFALDDTIARDRSEAALAILRSDSVRVIARARERTISGMAPSDTMIVSVEVLGDSTRHAARARYTVTPLSCDAWCLSDVLVIDPTKLDSAAGPVDAARAAYPELRVRADAPVAVFFELARTAAAPPDLQPASFALTVAPIRVGLVRRVAASIRLADRPEPVRMRWQDVVGSDARESRVIALRIPPSARGRYRLQVTVAPRGSAPVTATRELEIVR